MFVTIPRSRRRFRFVPPPALLGAAAIFAIAVAALAQAPGPDAAPPAAGASPAVAAPDAVAPADASAAATTKKADPTYWQLFRNGGAVMWILAGASVLAVTIIFERGFSLRRGQVVPASFLPGLKQVCHDPRNPAQREAGLRYCQDHDSPIARMVTAFLKRYPRGLAAAEKALEDAGGNEALRLRTNMRFFYAIGSVATLLGLVGTIAGMIRAFMVTAQAGDAGNKVELLSTGIYEAMVCTFGGLAVAILVTIFYYFFVGRIESLIGAINDEVNRFAEELGLNAESADELGVTRVLPLSPVPGGAVPPAVPVGTAYRPSVSV